MFLRLALGNFFCTWKVSLIGDSFGALIGFIIGNGELSLIILSPVHTLVYPLESPNAGDVLSGTLLTVPLGLWFGYKVVRCQCYCFCLMEFC